MFDFVPPERRVVEILERKGWKLYHTPWVIRGWSDLETVIKNGPTPILRRYELYTILPAVNDEKDPELVWNEMEKCLKYGRLPYFVKLRKVVIDGVEKDVPLWIMPIESLGIGDNDEFVLLADPNTVYQYASLIGYPDPEEASNGEIKYEAFSLTYYCGIDEIENFVRKKGKPFIYPKEEEKEWEELVSIQSWRV